MDVGGFLILVISKAKWYPFFMLGTLYLFKDTGSAIEDAIIKLWSRIRLDRATKLVLAICMAVLVVGLGKESAKPLPDDFHKPAIDGCVFCKVCG